MQRTSAQDAKFSGGLARSDPRMVSKGSTFGIIVARFRAGWSRHCLPDGELAHVDLAGDGGGDQRGAAFLEQVDGALGFGD